MMCQEYLVASWYDTIVKCSGDSIALIEQHHVCSFYERDSDSSFVIMMAATPKMIVHIEITPKTALDGSLLIVYKKS